MSRFGSGLRTVSGCSDGPAGGKYSHSKLVESQNALLYVKNHFKVNGPIMLIFSYKCLFLDSTTVALHDSQL